MSNAEAVDFAALWRLLAPGLLPAPVAEFRFHPTRRWRFDWAWPAERVALEVDGGQWKPGGGRHGSDSDRLKLNTAAALGWRVLRFSPRALVDDPAGCVELAAAAVILRDDRPAEEKAEAHNDDTGAGLYACGADTVATARGGSVHVLG